LSALASLLPKSSKNSVSFKPIYKTSYLVGFKPVDGAVEGLLENLSAGEDDDGGGAEFDANLVEVKLDIM